MKKKKDLRIIKTKASLCRGLMELMKEKSFEEIKVSDICTKSLINRSTFYDHFKDKYELLQSLINDMKKELQESLTIDKKTNTIKEFYMEISKILIEYIVQKKDIYKAGIKIKGNSIATDMMINILLESITKEINENYNNESKIPTKTLVLFYASGIINTINDYLIEEDHFNKEELYNILDKLIPKQEFIKK